MHVPKGMTAFRVRAKSADGQLAVSRPVLRSNLSEAIFASDSHTHGDYSLVEVKGTDLDGEAIEFVIEVRDDRGRWQHFAVVEGVMHQGRAVAEVELTHPAAGRDVDAPAPAEFRVHARVKNAP